MKLLSKQEVHQSQVLDRKAEIDQGRLLAQKVDKLRELSSTEQRALEAYRTETISALRNEVMAWQVERDIALEEAKAATEARDIAMLPINNRAVEFDAREASLAIAQKAVKDEQETIAIKTIESVRREDAVQTTEKELKQRIEAVERVEKEALEREEATKQLLWKAQRAHELAEYHKKASEEEILFRLGEVAVREVNAKLGETANAREQQRLSEKERGIIDREEQLQREIARKLI